MFRKLFKKKEEPQQDECYIKLYVDKSDIKIEFSYEDSQFQNFKILSETLISGVILNEVHSTIIEELKKAGLSEEVFEMSNIRKVLIKPSEFRAMNT
jgi:hypothetical protein